MKMKIIIPILMLLVLMGIVSAATVVTQDPAGSLANNTYQTTSSIDYGFNVTGNQSSWLCYLYTDENGSNGAGDYEVKVTGMVTANNTNVAFPTRTSVADGTGTANYTWAVKCNGTTDATGDWTTNGNSTESAFTYGVDITDPVVVINYPASNGVWYTDDSLPRLGLTVTDTNANICILETNLHIDADTSNSTYYNLENYSYTTATAFNFTKINSSQDWSDNNTGDYLWTYTCTDDAGNSAALGSNYSFYVDTVAPSSMAFTVASWTTDNVLLWNATTATDYTPTIGWDTATEANFYRYVITYFLDAYGVYNSTTDVRTYETNQSAILKTTDTLAADSDYYILVTAVDLAGNEFNMSTTGYKYSTDSTNRALLAGWNIIGNVGNAFNLSDLRTWTGATTVSIWNATHEFQSHVSGGSYGALEVAAGQPVLVYVAADTTMSDLVWNTTVVLEETYTNITNQSASAWNLLMMGDDDDDKNMGEFDKYINCNITGEGCSLGANNASYVEYMSFYNNSASTGAKYISFVGNWITLSSKADHNMTDQTLHYGDCLWAFLDVVGTDGGLDAKDTININWTAVS